MDSTGVSTGRRRRPLRTILEEKRERRLEQGEVATLKQEISDLKGELRDTRWDLGRNPRLASVLTPVC
jgi:hypothetical protein